MRRIKHSKKLKKIICAVMLAAMLTSSVEAVYAADMTAAETDTEIEPEAGTASETGTVKESEADAEIGTEALDTESEGVTEPKEDVENESETDPGNETAGEVGSKTDEESEAEAESGIMTETEAESESGSGMTTEIETESEAEPETMTETELETETGTETETELDSENEGITESEIMEETAGSELKELFPGLAGDSELSSAMLEEKELLSEYMEELEGFEDGDDYAAGEIIVSAESLKKAELYAAAYGGELIDYQNGAALIRLSKARKVAEAVAASAEEEILLPAAWPNYMRYLFEETEDVYLNPGESRYQYYHSMISSDAAWRAGYKGSGVRVAVLDTGIKSGHEDVTAEAYDNGTQGSYNFGAEDGHGHGTHVAGIIGAGCGNGKGGSGVAPEATLISIKVINDNGSVGNSWSLLSGIDQAIAKNADIINMSIGGPGYNRLEEEAVERAYKNGIAVFAAAGNESSSSAYYPAAYLKVFSVAALDKNTGRAWFSNYGPTVDYCAPGTDIWSTWCTGASAYAERSGTSQATPIAAGAAAVLLSSDAMPKGVSGMVKVEALRRLMDKGAIKVSASGVGKGYINLARALGLSTVQTAPKAPVFGVKSGSNLAQETAEIPILAENGMQIFYSVNSKALTYKNGVFSTETVLYDGPVRIEGTSKVIIQAIAVNPDNGLASKTVKATYYLKPLVSDITVHAVGDVNTVARGKTLQLTAQIAPAHAANRKVTWSVNPSGLGVKIDQNGLVSTTAKAITGTYLITAAAMDEGHASSEEFCVIVCDNRELISSVRAKKTEVTVYAGEAVSVGVTVKRGKQDASAFDLAWSSNAEDKAIVSVDPSGEAVIIRGTGAGKATVTGKAKDGSGKTVRIKITVKQYAQGISIEGASKLAAGKSIVLKAKVVPATTSNKKVRWSISPGGKGITVNAEGKVTAKGNAQAGIYFIRAVTADGSAMEAWQQIEVIGGAIKKISFREKTASVFRVSNQYGAETSVTLPVDLKASAGADTDMWTVTVSNSKIAEVSKSGDTVIVKATGRATGRVTVTAKTTDGSNLKAICQVTVNNPATRLLLAPQSGRSNKLAVGKSMKLSAVLEGASGSLAAAAKKIEWTSDRPDIISVDKNGKVTAKYADLDMVTITARTTDGSKVTAAYRLYGVEPVKKISLDYSTYEGKVGDTGRIGITLTRSDLLSPYCTKLVTEVSGSAVTTKIVYDKMGEPVLYVVMNKKGRAKVTIRCMDGSTASRNINFVVR